MIPCIWIYNKYFGAWKKSSFWKYHLKRKITQIYDTSNHRKGPIADLTGVWVLKQTLQYFSRATFDEQSAEFVSPARATFASSQNQNCRLIGRLPCPWALLKCSLSSSVWRYFFWCQNFWKPIPIFFPIPNFFETDTKTFFDTKNVQNRYRYHKKRFETKKFWNRNVTLCWAFGSKWKNRFNIYILKFQNN